MSFKVQYEFCILLKSFEEHTSCFEASAVSSALPSVVMLNYAELLERSACYAISWTLSVMEYNAMAYFNVRSQRFYWG
jgi:hypothetical protein